MCASRTVPVDEPIDATTPADMVDRARALAPRLRDRAAEARRLGRVPRETMDDFRDAGLFRLGQPRRFGGFEMGWDVLCEISQTLARGNALERQYHNLPGAASHHAMVRERHGQRYGKALLDGAADDN